MFDKKKKDAHDWREVERRRCELIEAKWDEAIARCREWEENETSKGRQLWKAGNARIYSQQSLCPKCLCDNIATVHEREILPSATPSLFIPAEITYHVCYRPERMVRTCPRCGYEWVERASDER